MPEPIYLTLLSEENADPVQLRQRTSNLQRQLNQSSSIRATSVTAKSRTGPETEKKGDYMMLYTLALAFVQTGAAKVLIDALRAVFSTSHDTKLKARLTVKGEDIEITSEHLSSTAAEELLRKIKHDFEAA